MLSPGDGGHDVIDRRPAPQPRVSSRELNPCLVGRAPSAPAPAAKGAPGYKWRMMKLERTYDMAKQRGVPVEEVAMERYGSMDAFHEACAERQFLDEQHHEPTKKAAPQPSSSGFQRPGTAQQPPPRAPPTSTSSPVPRATPSMDVNQLNQLEAQVLRAELLQKPEAASLREKWEAARQGTSEERVEIVPVMDGHGRLYDLGSSSSDQDTSLAELVRQERFGAGRADERDADAMLAQQIAGDRAFVNDTDYMDDEARRFARKRMRDDAMKRQYAMEDFARTKRALDQCPFCWQDDGRTPPQATIISSGSCVYLALPDREPLADGHCWIVPMHHQVSSLDVDEDGWTEIRNFMKCLLRMAISRNQSMVFFETVMSVRDQKHTYIEAVPIPNDIFAQVPAYFYSGLSEVESEWSDHKQVITFSEQRPFQHSMVSRLPYFMVQWDYKGQRGYGHVIEERYGDRHRTRRHRQYASDYEAPTYDDGDHVGGTGFPAYVCTTHAQQFCARDSRHDAGPRAASMAATQARGRIISAGGGISRRVGAV